MLTSAPIRLTARVSVALLKFSKPAFSVHRYVPLSPTGLTRSFVSSSRVAYAPEQTEIEPQQDSQVSEKKPKKTKDAASKSPAKTQKGQASKSKPKPKPIKITAEMLPPTGPATPYSRFLRDWYSRRPKPSQSEIGTNAKDISIEWRALSDSEKQPYIDGYHADREVYLEKRQEWLDNVDPKVLKALNQARKLSGKKRIRKPNPSNKPLGPFMQFSVDYRSRSEENLPPKEMSRRAGEVWRAMSDTEKQEYHDRYKNEMDAWRERNPTTT